MTLDLMYRFRIFEVYDHNIGGLSKYWKQKQKQ